MRKYAEQISTLTTNIDKLRKEVEQCEDIKKRIRVIDENLEELDKQENIKKLDGPIEKKKYADKLYESKTGSKNFVKESFLANYPEFDENYYFQDIKLLDGTDFKGKVDLFVGGSPCQSFS